MIKVEGWEFKVIEGSIELLKKYNPIIAMEVWGKERREKFSKIAIEKLYKLGFNSYRINQSGDLIECILNDKIYTLYGWLEVSELFLDWDNFIFQRNYG